MTQSKPKIIYTLEVEQDDEPVRGNAMVSGDDAADRQVEDEILARLDHGDVWAWALVTVTAQIGKYKGHDHLSGCCYKNEANFMMTGGYYEDMKARARDDLLENLRAAVRDGAKAALLLVALGEKGEQP